MTSINHKTVLIIGKSLSTVSGIAHELQAAGAQLIIGHAPSDADAFRPIASPLNARTVALDLDNPDLLDHQIAALGSLDIAILAPAWFKSVAFINSTPADWDAALHGNFEQNVYALRAVGKHLQSQGKGTILVLSSVAALSAHMDLSVVGTSLAALHIPARLAAVELAPYNITVNVVAMGWVQDEWSRDYLNPASQSALQAAIPMQRIGTFADITSVCRLLASEDARYLTGSVLSVDGGYSLHKASTPPPPRVPHTPNK